MRHVTLSETIWVGQIKLAWAWVRQWTCCCLTGPGCRRRSAVQLWTCLRRLHHWWQGNFGWNGHGRKHRTRRMLWFHIRHVAYNDVCSSFLYRCKGYVPQIFVAHGRAHKIWPHGTHAIHVHTRLQALLSMRCRGSVVHARAQDLTRLQFTQFTCILQRCITSSK